MKAGGDSEEVKFFSLNSLPEFSFDHERIIEDYITNKKGYKGIN